MIKLGQQEILFDYFYKGLSKNYIGDRYCTSTAVLTPCRWRSSSPSYSYGFLELAAQINVVAMTEICPPSKRSISLATSRENEVTLKPTF